MMRLLTGARVAVFVFFLLLGTVLFASGETAKQESSDPGDQSGEFSIKLRTLEERIDALKDKIFRSKQKLSILHETVLSGAVAGSRATIVHQNRVGRAFQLVSMIYYLDDAPVFKRINSPEELKKKEIVVYDGSLVPGPHHLSIYLVFKGRGFGLFSYMKGYDLKVQSGRSFNIDDGTVSDITVVIKDKGSVAKLADRLYLSFETHQKDFVPEKDEFSNDTDKSQNDK